MTTETHDAVRHSSSQLWLVAGVPALLIIAFLIYSAVSRSGKASHDTESETPAETSAEPGSGDDLDKDH